MTRAPGVNRAYGHGGALAYLAACDLHQARVFGRTEPRGVINPRRASGVDHCVSVPLGVRDMSSLLFILGTTIV